MIDKGCICNRINGGHEHWTRADLLRPITIQTHIDPVPEFIIKNGLKQLGLTHLVYPGALHTRFHHALGAMHLMTLAIALLRSKETVISEKEEVAAILAILLHDIGHGPFSHALENMLMDDWHHEKLSLLLMNQLNEEFNGELSTAIEMFRGQYHPILRNIL